jgi:uncharacterized protein
VIVVSDTSPLTALLKIDRALALELQADAVMMDERLGRRVAKSLGLVATGVLGCLLFAKREGFIAAVALIIADLKERGGCWFEAALIAAVLRAAGEE